MENTTPDAASIRINPDGSVSGLPLKQFHEQERQPAAADTAVTEWSKRARKVFSQIHQLKAEFFEALFTDAPWADLSDFADESRRFSAFVKQVFARLKPTEVGSLPSSTEVNSWFWLFKRRQQFREADVPEVVLPSTRKVQEALQSATAGLKSDEERLEVQIEILQRCAVLPNVDGPISASQVSAIAADLEIRKPLPPLPDFSPRSLDDMSTADWQRICHLGQQVRQELLKPTPEVDQRSRLLRLTSSLEDLCRHQTTWVCAVFEDEKFVGCLARQMGQKVGFCPGGEGQQGYSFKVHAQIDHKVIHGDDLIAAVLPMAERPTELSTYHRLIGCRGDRKIRQMLKHGTSVIQSNWKIEPLELTTLQAWFSDQGGVPLGTYVDEVIEPAFLHSDDDAQQGDGTPVL
jgi:hypothetical protein